jgi:cell division septation protein DedD
MGSFSSQTNAQALVNKMRAANHTAYYKAGEAGGKRIYRVFSGPYIKRNQAELASESLRKLANVSPIVVVFDPVKHAQR